MVKRYRANFPEVPVDHVRVQDARFAPETFDAVVARGVLFHLSEADQAGAIHRISTWLRPGGRLLFTSGQPRGVTEGEVNGVAFRYVSLGVGGYRSLLARAGMLLEQHHPDAWENYVYVATNARSPGG